MLQRESRLVEQCSDSGKTQSVSSHSSRIKYYALTKPLCAHIHGIILHISSQMWSKLLPSMLIF